MVDGGLEFPLRLVSPDFDAPLTDTLMELNHLRKLKLGGTTAPWMFFQLKNIFHILERILLPTLLKSEERRHITKAESRILQAGVRNQKFKAGDINRYFDGLDARQRTHRIAKMKDAGLIKPLKPGGRTYYVSFLNNFLMRSLIQVLESEDFIPPIDR